MSPRWRSACQAQVVITGVGYNLEIMAIKVGQASAELRPVKDMAARSDLLWTPVSGSSPVASGHGDSEGVVDAAPIEGLVSAAANTAKEFLAAAASVSARYLGGRGSCVLGDEKGARVVVSTEAPETAALRIDLSRYPEITAALIAGEPVFVQNALTDPLLADVRALLPSNLGAVCAAPLYCKGRPIGALLVQFNEPTVVDGRKRRTVGLLARLTSSLFEARFRAEDPSVAMAPLGSRPATKARPPYVRRATPIRGVELASAAPKRLLIAEDDEEQAAALAMALDEEGFTVKTVVNGAEAVKAAVQWQPDLILLDVGMPVLDGFGAAEELVKDEGTRHIPLLFLSGAENLLPRLRGLTVEESDFLRKPYDLNELFTRIERSLREAMTRANLRLKANHDELTGVGNLRHMREQIGIELSRLERYGTPMALVVADVDKLKHINDHFGHVVGSEVLKAIGTALRREIRETDLAARYGGDEFVIALPHSGAEEGMAFAARLLSRLRGVRVGEATISVSMGIAGFRPPRVATFDEMLAEADAAAYRAKRAGGNQACVFDPTLDV